MAILLSASSLCKAFGTRELFKNISFSVESGERVGLIGPNGAGKTTLLKILAGATQADSGSVSTKRGLRLGYLSQDPSYHPDATIFSTVMEKAADPFDWEWISKGHELLAKLELTADGRNEETPLSQLSGGWKKRVALARELLIDPELLLLDEPTNHLDIESILWLEEFLQDMGVATLTITHDRLFLQRIADRILELDRRNDNGLLSIKGDYATFLEVKEAQLRDLQKSEQVLKNTLRRETEWLRRGAKARQTKQQGRIQRAQALQGTVAELKSLNQNRVVQLEFQSTEKNPKRLIEAKGISKAFDGIELFDNLDLFIGPKTRLGLLGKNGCGKTTLIQALVGTAEVDAGKVIRADRLKVAYFEQNRDALRPDQSLAQTLHAQSDMVEFRGRAVHVRSYLGRFCFSPEQMDLPVGRLSGGEQGRLLLAKLMLQESNILVMDEPTNDLDMTTLQVLEDCLADFDGAVILVTHDRYFLDRVCNQVLAFPPTRVETPELVMFANVGQWEAWREEWLLRGGATESSSSGTKTSGDAMAGVGTPPEPVPSKKKKMSFKDQRDWDSMEASIQKAEELVKKLESDLGHPEVQSQATRLLELTQQLAAAQGEVERLYARWTELENLMK